LKKRDACFSLLQCSSLLHEIVEGEDFPGFCVDKELVDVSCLWSYADERFRIIRIAHQIPVSSVWNPYVQRTQKAATFWICTKALPSNCEPLAAIEAGRKC